MEHRLTTKDLLRNLLKSSRDPFITPERLLDIQKVLMTSSNFSGVNHLIMVKTYLEPDLYPFHLTKEEAVSQAKLAIDERNPIGYFYLYLLSDREEEKRKYLNISLMTEYEYAYLEYANLLHEGRLYQKNVDKAYLYFRKAADKGLADGYFGLMKIDIEREDYEMEKKHFKEARRKGIVLPGVVR